MVFDPTSSGTSTLQSPPLPTVPACPFTATVTGSPESSPDVPVTWAVVAVVELPSAGAVMATRGVKPTSAVWAAAAIADGVVRSANDQPSQNGEEGVTVRL